MKKCFTFLVLILAVLGLNGTMWGQTGLPSSGTWEQTTVSSDETVQLSGNVSLNGTITVTGCKLRIESGGAARSITNIKATNNLAGMFVLAAGGQLEIVGTELAPITIDGGANFSCSYTTTSGIDRLNSFTQGTGSKDLDAAAISLNGAGSVLDMQYVTIQNVDETKTIGGAIYVNANATVTANHCKIDKCRADQGAAVFATDLADGSITLTESEISNCLNSQSSTSDTYGGAIRGAVLGKAHLALTNVHLHYCSTNSGGAAISWASNGINGGDSKYATLTLNGCNLHNNYSTHNGGAIDALGNFMLVGDTTGVHHNYAADNGGGIAFRLYNTTNITGTPVTDVVFQANDKLKVHDNCAADNGGGISFEAKNVNKFGNGSSFTYTLDGAEVYGNKTTSYNGGGIYLENLNTNANYTFAFNLLSGNIHDNQSQNGGGVYISKGSITLSDNADKKLLVNDNVASSNGGGIYIKSGTVTQGKGISVCRNKSTGYGAGIYTEVACDFYNLTVTGNTASSTATDYGGGGIYTTASLTLEKAVVKENTSNTHGGGIFTKNTLSLTDVDVESNTAASNGGGIYINTTTDGSAWSKVKIDGNTAEAGGGVWIHASGTVAISGEHSTIDRNTATGGGGGGIRSAASLTLTNVEVNGNTSKTFGGGIYTTKPLTLTDVDVKNNIATNNYGGGIYIYTTDGSAWSNVEIDGNKATNGGGVYINSSGAVTISGGSTIDGNIATTGTGGGIHGGSAPLTLTNVEVNGNTAQTFGGGIHTTKPLTLTNVDVKDNIATKNNGGGIYISTTTASEWSKVKIDGNKAGYGGGVYINNSGIVTISGEGSTIDGNTATTDGGGIYLKCKIEFDDVVSISNNKASRNGGGIFNATTANHTWKNVNIKGNTAKNGGGIWLNAGYTTTLSETVVLSHNSASADGGGFYVKNGTLELAGGTIGGSSLEEGNWAVNGGGGYVYDSKTFILTSGSVSYNTATTNGGGICSQYGNVTINGGQLNHNKATKNGGGVYFYGYYYSWWDTQDNFHETYRGTFKMANAEVRNNEAGANGGGIYLDGTLPSTTPQSITSCTIFGNKATLGGGVLFAAHGRYGGILDVDGGTISSNIAETGGGFCVYCPNALNPTLRFNNATTSANVLITENTVSQNGGAIAVVGLSSSKKGTVQFMGKNNANTIMQKNTAGKNGGGIYAVFSTVTINQGVVIGDTYSAESPVNYANANTAALYGGGIFVKDCTFNFYTGTVIGNKATHNGGGIYLAGSATKINDYSTTSYRGDKRISSNIAERNGGGIYVNIGKKTLTLGTKDRNNVYVDNNQATNGGGLYVEKGTVSFLTGEINNNYASNYGGGLFVADPAKLEASYAVSVNHNHVPAEGLGGGIYLEGAFTVAKYANTVAMINENYAGAAFSQGTQNNVYLYLPCENKPNKSIIFVNTYSNLNGNSRIGISEPYINVPVIYCANTGFLDGFVNKTNPQFFTDQDGYDRSRIDKYAYLTKKAAITWVEAQTTEPEGFDPQNIDSKEDLAWFISYVNGLNGSAAHYDADGKLTADLNMNEHYWVPIGTSGHPYTGTFDGNGHDVAGLEITFNNPAEGSVLGMFGYLSGTVKNITLKQTYFSTELSTLDFNVGSIAAVMKGGTILDCDVQSFGCSKSTNSFVGGFIGQVLEGESTIKNSTSSAKMLAYNGGGFVGKVSGKLNIDDVISNADINTYENSKANAYLGGIVGRTVTGSSLTISNSISYAAITNGYYEGGFVGEAIGTLDIYNGFAMPFLEKTTVAPTYAGGFVGYMSNTGSYLRNSFAVLDYTSLSSSSSGHHAGLVGYNKGKVQNCYSRYVGTPGSCGRIAGNNDGGSVDHCYAESTPYVHANTAATNTYKYTATQPTPYLYKQNDNTVTVSSVTKPLMAMLNEWVETQETRTATFARWARPTTDRINLDYPVLMRTDNGYNAVATDSANLVYGTINGLLSDFGEDPTYQIFLYESVEDIEEGTSEGGAELYIHEDVGLTQCGDKQLKAHVGITLDNSAGVNGANPEDEVDAIDWHFFSTSLKDAPLGIDYIGDDSTYTFEIQPLPHYRFTSDGYFPTHIFGKDPELETSNYYDDWDFYTYYEPEYQWVNFKRNRNSHYNHNTEEHFDYENEDTLVPGKGYMVALKEQTYLQCEGTLNNSDVSIRLSHVGDFVTGYNMLGNPYQSYLDFNKFAEANTDIWDGGYENASYIIMDEDQKGYVVYGYGASVNEYTAPQYLHPHQGFMVVAKANCTATFNNDMRSARSHGSTFRGSERPAYPLVNLLAYDENGNRDLTTIEVGRSDKGGALKFREMNASTGLIYTHYENESYGIAFVEPGVSSVPVRFETTEDANYTMKWDVENGTFSYLHLIDNLTGADVDCLKSEEYHFTSRTSDYSSRFKLVFEYTGIDENESGADAEAEETFAFFMDGNLVVNGEGNLEVIDINGRILKATSIYGSQNVIAMPNVATGLYILRMTSENGVKVQKILVE